MTRQFLFSANEQLSFFESLNECLLNLESVYQRKNVLGVIFFIDSNTDADYFMKKKQIQLALEHNKLMMPYNVQSQASNDNFTIEIWFDDFDIVTEYLILNDIRYTRVTSTMGTSIWGMGITCNSECLPLADQIEFSFETVLQILEKEGMTLADIVRQWNYIPSILTIHDIEGKKLQNYQVFNEIRQKYYSTVAFKDGFPAATGIGTRNGNYDLDFFAIKSSPTIQKVGLSNPKQHNAYEYQQSFLVGDTTSGQSKKAPLFERAKMLRLVDESMIFISGTASIIGQETIGIGDIKCQTEITINNMQELIPNINDLETIPYTYLRAYIKEECDFPAVRSICETLFPDVPVSYLKADVCRDNLLVEIEGAVLLHS
jgi:enamine deaminase RidA (YjgF/YER057c/UK114 family)